jgi:hypothetical protein
LRRNARNWWIKNKTEVTQPSQQPQSPLNRDLSQNEETLREIFSNCSDVVFRPFLVDGTTKAMLVYIEGLANIEEMHESVLAPLMHQKTPRANGLLDLMEKRVSVAKWEEIHTIEGCIESVFSGFPIVLIDQEDIAVSIGLVKYEKRSIEEPTAESAIRGPREGFTEALNVNTSLLRRIIKTPLLKMDWMQIGGYTKTSVVISYIQGIADPTLVNEVRTRLQRIDVDGILESGYIEEYIEDYPASPFPQILSTERPDRVSANLLEGRVAILIDGTPFVLVAPTTFFTLLQANEDYYQRSISSTALRWLRYLFLVISGLLPSIYVALITFHHEMVPTSLLISMASAREAVPFPALVEALLMEITFEALREAGVRLPKQVGSAVSIVGALVIGQAAVQAGLVSAPMVIVVAITGIASFMIPHYISGIALRLLRFPMIFLAGSLGLLGIMLGIITVVVHMCTLRSFGVPYLSPIAPLKTGELKDVIVRAPWWMMDTRPHFSGEMNKYRQAPGMKPDPSKGGETK